jgi:hypothetical protein
MAARRAVLAIRAVMGGEGLCGAAGVRLRGVVVVRLRGVVVVRLRGVIVVRHGRLAGTQRRIDSQGERGCQEEREQELRWSMEPHGRTNHNIRRRIIHPRRAILG